MPKTATQKSAFELDVKINIRVKEFQLINNWYYNYKIKIGYKKTNKNYLFNLYSYLNLRMGLKQIPSLIDYTILAVKL